jgi:hypothetical protein
METAAARMNEIDICMRVGCVAMCSSNEAKRIWFAWQSSYLRKAAAAAAD